MPTADDHYQVTLDDILLVHDAMLALGGGRPGISRMESVLGAIGRPYIGYFETLEEKAAALMHGVASSHGFSDGNKRTATAITLVMIGRSGHRIDLRDGERLDDVPVDLIEGRISQDDLIVWFRERLAPL